MNIKAKNRKNKTVFIGFYSAKGGVGKTTCLFSLSCLITHKGYKNTNKICIINCDYSSESIKSLLSKHGLTVFDESDEFIEGVMVFDNDIRGLKTFAFNSLDSSHLRNIRYVLVDFAGFEMTSEQLKEVSSVIDIWIIPLYPSDLSEKSVTKVYKSLLEVGYSKSQIITFINKIKPTEAISKTKYQEAKDFIINSQLIYPKNQYGEMVECEFTKTVEMDSDDTNRVSLISNSKCRQVLQYCYDQISELWNIKNNK